MFKKNYTLIIYVWSIIACTNSRYPSNPMDYFPLVEDLPAEKVLVFDDEELLKPSAIVIDGADMYVQNAVGNAVLCRLNRHTGRKDTLLLRGGASDEVYSIAYITASGGGAVTAECNKHQLIQAFTQADSGYVTFADLPGNYGAYTSVAKVQNGYVLLGTFPEGRYMYYHPADGKVGFFGDYPVSERYSNLDNRLRSLINISSRLTAKPDGSRIATVTFTNGVIEICSVSADSIQLLRRMDFHYQDVTIGNRNGEPRISTRKRNKNGFFDIAASDGHIYALYSGKSLEEAGLGIDDCEYLMVFDWDGMPVHCYKPPVPLCAICYSPSDNTVYGVSLGEESILLKFKII